MKERKPLQTQGFLLFSGLAAGMRPPVASRCAVVKAVAMLHTGQNIVNGVPVEVVRKSIRRINIRVMPDGCVKVSVPRRWATLREA